jgi:hypothetical protein
LTVRRSFIKFFRSQGNSEAQQRADNLKANSKTEVHLDVLLFSQAELLKTIISAFETTKSVADKIRTNQV